MKRSFYVIIGFIAFGLFSCKKNANDVTIKQYDENSIQKYIADNGLTGMKRDTTGGDTTGIYYQIISQGTGAVVDYPDLVAYAYAYHTFDGGYSTTDTIINHTHTYVGHITPTAVQIGVKNLLKRKGGKIRLLIPSRLAFGINGYFSGSIAINGNQCLDYTVSLVDNQATYDDVSIKKYMAANSLSGYTKTASGLWYKEIVHGTGTDPISISSTVGVQYTGTLLNGTAFDTEVTTDGTAATSFTLYDVVPGFAEALSKTTAGGQISFIMPSTIGYGADSRNSIPAFSCLRYEVTVVNVSN
ncbi:FKBP-type peptidyl-prolyl cis-trans isomerase [Mucilaginibacter sp. AW1-3]